MYDITNLDSFNNVKRWLEEINKCALPRTLRPNPSPHRTLAQTRTLTVGLSPRP